MMNSERPEENTLAQQAENALQEAAQKVAAEARRTNGTVVVWQQGAVVEIPADQLPPTPAPAE
ncbi:MAG: hypothetical protein ABSF26_10645 [Thermoguttaceae bacterium]|jgi:hypothetical protein